MEQNIFQKRKPFCLRPIVYYDGVYVKRIMTVTLDYCSWKRGILNLPISAESKKLYEKVTPYFLTFSCLVSLEEQGKRQTYRCMCLTRERVKRTMSTT